MNHKIQRLKSILTCALLFIVIVISGGILGTQYKSAISWGEVVGITKETYAFEEKVDYGDDVIDFFADPNNYSRKLVIELDRAQLRDWDYPDPIFFYISS